MNKRTLLIRLAGLLIALLLASTATAQTSTSFNLAWYVLAGGGERAASANFALNSTLGQWAAGPADAASYAMNSGYWQPWPDLLLYLPLVLKSSS